MVKTFRKKRKGDRRTKRKYHGGLDVRIIDNEVIPDDIRENNIESDGTVVFFIENRFFIDEDGIPNPDTMNKIIKELMKLEGKRSQTSTTVVKKIIIIFLLQGEKESDLKFKINKFIDDDKDNENIIALTDRTIFLGKASTDFSDWIDILRSKNSRRVKSTSKALSKLPSLPVILEAKSKSKYNSPYAQSLSTTSRSGSSDGSSASSRSSGRSSSSSSSSGRSSSSSSSSGRSGSTFSLPPITKLSADQLKQNTLTLNYPDYYSEYIKSGFARHGISFETYLKDQKYITVDQKYITVGGRHKRRRTFKKEVKVPNKA
jgi:hypothetical protein